MVNRQSARLRVVVDCPEAILREEAPRLGLVGDYHLNVANEVSAAARLVRAGARWFRVELVDETGEEARRVMEETAAAISAG